jgi:hypothetical protein
MPRGAGVLKHCIATAMRRPRRLTGRRSWIASLLMRAALFLADGHFRYLRSAAAPVAEVDGLRGYGEEVVLLLCERWRGRVEGLHLGGHGCGVG